MTYISGFHAIEEQIQSGRAKSGSLLVATPGPRIKKIVALAEKAKVTIKKVSPAELDRLAPDNRGAALSLQDSAETPELDIGAWIASGVPERCMVLMLDHIEDPHNLGAILRSADVFAADLVIIPQRRAAKETDTVARVSAGAIAYVPLASVTNLARTLTQLKEAGFWAYSADMKGTPLPEADLPKRVVLVLGSEGEGVSRLLADTCDGTLCIPQFGHVDSLNVSVAAGIFMYETRKRLGAPSKK